MRRFRQASILAQVSWRPSRVGLYQTSADMSECPTPPCNAALRRGLLPHEKPATKPRQPLHGVLQPSGKPCHRDKPGSGLHFTLLPPPNACVTAVTKICFYFLGSDRLDLCDSSAMVRPGSYGLTSSSVLLESANILLLGANPHLRLLPGEPHSAVAWTAPRYSTGQSLSPPYEGGCKADGCEIISSQPV
jgi:hypothetical protein